MALLNLGDLINRQADPERIALIDNLVQDGSLTLESKKTVATIAAQ